MAEIQPKNLSSMTTESTGEDIRKRVVSRVADKLFDLLLQQPTSLLGVEDDVYWIQRELKGTGNEGDFEFTEELVDVACDLEVAIDSLLLNSEAEASGRRRRRSFPPAFPSFADEDSGERGLAVVNACTLQLVQDIEEKDWSHSSSSAFHEINIEKNTVVSSVMEKVKDLLSMESLTPKEEESARRVEEKLDLMNDFLRDFESVELDYGGRVSVWIDELSQVCRSTEDLIDQFLNSGEKSRRRWLGGLGRYVLALRHCIFQHKFVLKMNRISSQFMDIFARRPRGSHGEGPSTVQSMHPPPHTSHQPSQELAVTCFDDEVFPIVTQLLSDDTSFTVFSIGGMPGIGKTTLAKLIYNNKAIIDHFPFRVWTSGTWEFLKHMMGQEISLMTVEEMRERFIFLLAGQRCLIVFDNETDSSFFNHLVSAFSDVSNGSRIILTTPSMALSSSSLQRSVHHAVRLRGNDESWALFIHALNVKIPEELLTLRREIEQTCGGLPLAIVRLANMLSHKSLTIDEWSTVLQQIKHVQEQLWSYQFSRIHKDLSWKMQQCLYYFGLFPRDFEIPARRLIALWVAEGLVEANGEDEAPEDVAERILIKLIAEGMVRMTKKKLNGNIKTCCLPDALKEHCIQKAQKAKLLQIGMKTTSHISLATVKIRRLTDHLDREDITFDHIHGCHDNNMDHTLYQDVVSFLSFDTREGSKPGEDMGKFLRRCISRSCLLQLKVLDLENVYKPELSKVLGKLTQLRYLGLRSTFLDMLPCSIKKLQNLQVLDVKHTNITTLPGSIWNLQKLRRLYLDESCHNKFMPRPRAGSYSTLQVLVGLFLDEETPVKDGLDQFLNLRELGLKCRLSSSQQEAMVELILKTKRLQSLRLKSIDEHNQLGDLSLKPLTDHVHLSCLYLLGRLKNPCIVLEFPQSD